MTALAEPAVFLSGRPAAQWAADARAGWVAVSLNIAVRNDCGVSVTGVIVSTEFSLLRQSCSDFSRSLALPYREDQRT